MAAAMATTTTAAKPAVSGAANQTLHIMFVIFFFGILQVMLQFYWMEHKQGSFAATDRCENHNNDMPARITPATNEGASSPNNVASSTRRVIDAAPRTESAAAMVGMEAEKNNAQPILPEPPYGAYCETRPRGERQLWKIPYKQIISVSMFTPPGATKLPQWVLTGLQVLEETTKLYFPDWVIRVYAIGVDDAMINMIISRSSLIEIVKCREDSPIVASGIGARRMMTRFMAIDDPTVRTVLVRDVDSRFSFREVMAVNEFLSDDEVYFHTIRDHSQHVIAVMGGMFGMKRGLFSAAATAAAASPSATKRGSNVVNIDQYVSKLNETTMTQLVEQAIRENPQKTVPGCCADDQNYLSKYVWPYVKQVAMDHDMQPTRCKRYKSKKCRPFRLGPRNDKTFFIGFPFKDADRSPTSVYDCSINCQVGQLELEHPWTVE